jgi:hypothetical protein
MLYMLFYILTLENLQLKKWEKLYSLVYWGQVCFQEEKYFISIYQVVFPTTLEI